MTTAPKIKVALCMKTDDLPSQYFLAYHSGDKPLVYPVLDALLGQPTGLVERTICESDDDYKQLLPYILVTNHKDEIFSYYRGGAGEESRLHGLISIGLGGHVDILPPRVGSKELHDVLESEAQRELFEEIGIRTDARLDFLGAIIDPTNAVGRVHLGLLTHYRLSESDQRKMELELGMIEKFEFRTLLDLRRPEVYDRLENWSKAVVDFLLARQ